MQPLGFSTGALALSDFRRALQVLREQPVQAVELSAIRENELVPLLHSLEDLDLSQFSYFSIHAPSSFSREAEGEIFRDFMRPGITGGPSSFTPIPFMTSLFGGCLAIFSASRTWTNESRLAERFGSWSFCSRSSLRRPFVSISVTPDRWIHPWSRRI